MQEILIICLIGAIAGWIASALLNFESDSIFLNIIIGIVGGYVGHRLFGHKLHITDSKWVNLVLTSAAGAAILVLGIKLIRKVTG